MKESPAERSTPNVEEIMQIALRISKDEGTEVQYGNVAGLVSQLSHYHRELVDMEKGIKAHDHHPVEQLRKLNLWAVLFLVQYTAQIKGFQISV